MIAKHSFNIFTSRFSLVYKTMLFLILVTVLIMAIAISAIYPVASPLIKEIKEVHIIQHVGEAFSSMFSGDMTEQETAFTLLKSDYHDILDIFKSHSGIVSIVLVMIFLFYFIYKFISTLCHVPITDVANHFMTSNSRFGFTSNFILNIKKALSFSLLHTLIAIPLTAIFVGVLVLAAFIASKTSMLILGALAFLLIVIMLSIKRSLFALWLPTMLIENKTAGAALIDNFKNIKSSFSHIFGYYFIMYIVITALTVVSFFATFGIALLLAGGIITVLFRISDLVIYYRKNRMKYYVDSDTVVNSKNAVSDGYCE